MADSLKTTEVPSTPVTTPKSAPAGAADGPGVPEEESYASEAASMAASVDDAFEGLDFEDQDSSGGVEAPAVGGGETPAAPAVDSPAAAAVPEAPRQDTGATAPVAPTPAAEVAAVGGTPGQQAAPAAQPAVAPAATAAGPAAVQPQPGAGTPEQPAGDLIAQVRSRLDENRETFAKALAEQVYPLSEEDCNNLLVEPQKVLPQLAAKVHLEVVQNVLGTLSQVLPGVVFGVQAAQRQQTELEDRFFQAWPTLDRAADYTEVMNLARVFRQQFPAASAEEMIKQVGAMAVVKLGKLPAAAAQAPAQQATPAAAQAYRPAVGTPSAVQPAQRSDNPWEGISELLVE